MESNSDKLSDDNEHYSVDEMMSRLKQSDRRKRSGDPAKDGELVTRPDGTQVIKVRRRKRRSKQRAKKNTNPRVKWLILAIPIGLFILLVAGTVFIIAKYNGRSFKEKTESSISELVGADSTELSQLRVTPVSASADTAKLSWGKSSFYHSAHFSKINASILATSFLSRDWVGEEVVADEGVIQLQTPLTNISKPASAPLSNYKFDSFRCEQLDVYFGQEDNAPSITGIQTSLRLGMNERYQIVYSGGLMQIQGWPTLEITSGVLTLGPSATQIEARLASAENPKGEILIKGDVAKDTQKPMLLDVQSKNYPIQELLGKDLGRIIRGKINSDTGSLSYHFKKASPQALSFIMPFNSGELFISELPMLTDLKELTGDTQYVRPTLTHCSGTIMRTLEGVTLDHLNLIGSRLITIQGSISVSHEGGRLSGTLRVGIPSRFFGRNHPIPSVFSRPHNGYVHTDVTLGGTIYNPHDDLNDRLQASRDQAKGIPSADGRVLPITPLSPLEHSDKQDKPEARQKEEAFEELTR